MYIMNIYLCHLNDFEELSPIIHMHILCFSYLLYTVNAVTKYACMSWVVICSENISIFYVNFITNPHVVTNGVWNQPCCDAVNG